VLADCFQEGIYLLALWLQRKPDRSLHDHILPHFATGEKGRSSPRLSGHDGPPQGAGLTGRCRIACRR
jgi:hypothetical protein